MADTGPGPEPFKPQTITAVGAAAGAGSAAARAGEIGAAAGVAQAYARGAATTLSSGAAASVGAANGILVPLVAAPGSAAGTATAHAASVIIAVSGAVEADGSGSALARAAPLAQVFASGEADATSVSDAQGVEFEYAVASAFGLGDSQGSTDAISGSKGDAGGSLSPPGTGIPQLLTPGFANVTLDAKTVFGSSQNAVTSFNDTRLTVGTGSNRALVVWLYCESVKGSLPATPTATWDSGGSNQAMTLVGSSPDTRATHDASIFCFGLANPASGNLTLAIAGLNANTDSIVAAIAFTGANQTGGTTTFANLTKAAVPVSGTTATASITINQTSSDAATACFTGNDGTPTVNQTNLSPSTLTTFGTNFCIANYQIGPSASPASLTMTQSSAPYNYVGIDVTAAVTSWVGSAAGTGGATALSLGEFLAVGAASGIGAAAGVPQISGVAAGLGTDTRGYGSLAPFTPVAQDAWQGFGASQDGVTSFTDTRFTVGTGSNRALVIFLACESTLGNLPTAPTATWDSGGTNQAMTLIAHSPDSTLSHAYDIFAFGLVAPVSGNKTLSIGGLNSNCNSIVCGISFTNVNQALAFVNSTVPAGSPGWQAERATASITISNPRYDAAVACFAGNQGQIALSNYTFAVKGAVDYVTNVYAANYQLAPSASPASLTMQQDGFGNYDYVGFGLVAANAPSVGSGAGSGAAAGVSPHSNQSSIRSFHSPTDVSETNIQQASLKGVDIAETSSPPPVTVSAVGAAAGVGAASAFEIATEAATGAAAGVGVASGIATSTALASGLSTGSGAASATAAPTAGATGAADSIGAAAAQSAEVASSAGSAAGTGVAAATTGEIGSAQGVGAASGANASQAISIGAASGTGAAAAYEGEYGAADGIGSAQAVGASQAAASGLTAGLGSASGVANPLASGVGSAAGVGGAAAVISASAAATGAAAGFGAATATAFTSALAVGAAPGIGTASGFPSGTTASTGEADGVGAATGVIAGTGLTIGAAAGIGAASGVLVGTTALVGAAAGIGSAQAPATGLSSAAGAAFSAGVAFGFSEALAGSVGEADGVGTASAVYAAAGFGVGEADGIGAAFGASAEIEGSVGTAAGVGAAAGVSEAGFFESSGWAPAFGAATAMGSTDPNWQPIVGSTIKGGGRSGAAALAAYAELQDSFNFAHPGYPHLRGAAHGAGIAHGVGFGGFSFSWQDEDELDLVLIDNDLLVMA